MGLKAIPSNNLGTISWSLPANALASGGPAQLQQQQQPTQPHGQQVQPQAQAQTQTQEQQQQPAAKAKSQASGLYVFYQDPNGLLIGTTRRTPSGAASFTRMQDCMTACDDDTA